MEIIFEVIWKRSNEKSARIYRDSQVAVKNISKKTLLEYKESIKIM